jgi:hypothetical protein
LGNPLSRGKGSKEEGNRSVGKIIKNSKILPPNLAIEKPHDSC